MSTPTRSVLRYRGGKWKLAPWIIGHFPPHAVYVEPYGGSGAVLLQKHRAPIAEVFNDLDGEIINVFRVLRDQWAALECALRLTPFARAEYECSSEPSADPVEQARRTIVRFAMAQGVNGHSGNSGFDARQNHAGRISHALAWSHYPAQVRAFADRFAGVAIENCDALLLIDRYDSPDTLLYIDPPYVPGTWQGGAYRHELTDDDHRILAGVLRNVRGGVVLSGYPCELYDRELYPDWYRTTRQTLADGARKHTEVLYLNARAAAALNPMLFDDHAAVANE